MGHDQFTAAFKEIYQLATTESRLITEQEIYQTFLRHTPMDKIDDFQELYDRWHGGDFSTQGQP